MRIFALPILLAFTVFPFSLATARAAGPTGFAPADSFRTVHEILPGKSAREKSITLRWAPVSCVSGYVVHLARTEDMAKPRVMPTGARNFLTFPTGIAGGFYWQVGCAGEKTAEEAGVETHSLAVKDHYLPSAVPAALTKRVVRKAGAGDSLAFGGANPDTRYRLEVYSSRFEPLSERESSADDAYWPSVGPGFYYYRVQSMDAQGEETYASPLNALQVEGRAGESSATRAGASSRGIMIAAGGGLIGQTGTQTSQGINGDLSAGTTGAIFARAQWNWNPRWSAEFRFLSGSSSYNDVNNSFQVAKFSSLEWRAVAQTYLPAGSKFWTFGAGIGSRNHPFVQINGFTLTLASMRTVEIVARAGAEWRPARWRHTVILDLMAPLSYAVPNVDTSKGSLGISGEIELTSYYFFTPRFSVGGFLNGRLSNAKFNYQAGLTNQDVQVKFRRASVGLLGAYNF